MTNRRPTDIPAAKPAARRTITRKPAATAGTRAVSAGARRAMIAERAYLRAERRGFVAGREAEDWLAAESEIDSLLKAARAGSSQ